MGDIVVAVRHVAVKTWNCEEVGQKMLHFMERERDAEARRQPEVIISQIPPAWFLRQSVSLAGTLHYRLA